jgi:hypothetical protein
MADFRIDFGPTLMLVAIAEANPMDLRDPTRAGCFPAHGLMLHQPTVDGATVELFVEASSDLLDFANLSALSLLKPVCLPIAIQQVRAGRIDTTLRTDATARTLAHTIHGAIASLKPRR